MVMEGSQPSREGGARRNRGRIRKKPRARTAPRNLLRGNQCVSDLGLSLPVPPWGPSWPQVWRRRGKLPLAVHHIDVDIQMRDTAALLRITSLPQVPSQLRLFGAPRKWLPHILELCLLEHKMGMHP